MSGAQDTPAVVVVFTSARDAERRVAGIAAIARIAREVAAAGFSQIFLDVGGDKVLGSSALADLRRVAGSADLRIGAPPADAAVVRIPGDRLVSASAIPALVSGETQVAAIDLTEPGAAAEILRDCGKQGDGIVSRWLNRPISRRISAVVLRIPGVRPIHASAATVLLAALMFASFAGGGRRGLIAGALLFQIASIVDGVDGELARATFRSSRTGAAIDTAIDVGTNFLFIAGLAVNLDQAGHREAYPLAVFGLALLGLGLGLIGWRTVNEGNAFRLELVKDHYRGRSSGPLAARMMDFLTMISSHDFSALASSLLVIVGLPLGLLYAFAAAVPVWLTFVLVALMARPRLDISSENA
jgi:CDP-L-myo-inositol myo-inositolphosphotransferase